MNDIFISYRRDDSSDVTGRICDRLKDTFGVDHLFKDVDNIPFGVDFRKVLSEAVQSCDVLIAIIGDEWLTLKDDSGRRRIDDPQDYVHVEIASALERDIPVIPVLVEGAQMPSADDLPEALKSLAFRNAAAVRHDPDFHNDIERLCTELRRTIQPSPTPQSSQAPRAAWVVPVAFGTAMLVLLLVAMVFVIRSWSIGGADPVPAVGEPELTSAPALPTVRGKLHFVGIAINKYEFQSLEYADEDIELLQETLKFNNSRLRQGTFVTLYNSDATRTAIIAAIANLRQTLDRDDVGIIAFAGMEALTNEEIYILPADVSKSALESPEILATAAISARDIFEAIPNTKGQIVFLLDTCHSGRLAHDLLSVNPSIVTLASSQEDQFSYEGRNFRTGGGGAFTTAVVQGCEGEADADGDGAVTIKELAKFVESKTPMIVGEKGRQDPVVTGDLLPVVLTVPRRQD